MVRELPGATLLISGSILAAIAMLFHPTGADLMENFARQARVNGMVHSAALVALPMIFLGLMAVRRRLGCSDAATAALVVHGFTTVAYMLTTVDNGFVQTELIARMLDAEGDQLARYEALSEYTFFFTQGFLKLAVVASSTSIGLWSLAILQTGQMTRSLAIAGAILGAGVLVVFLSGHLSLDLHGVGIAMAGQAVWFIWLGIILLKSPSGSTTSSQA